MTDSDLDPRDWNCASTALGAWGLERECLSFVSAGENIVFKVEAADGRRFALRLHRPGYHSLAELESENRWTRALSDFGVRTPRPIPTRSGTAYADVAYGNGERRIVGLVEWIAGRPMSHALAEHTCDRPATMARVGAIIARMHNQATSWDPGAGFVRHRLDADGLVGTDPWWGPFWDLPEMNAAQSRTALQTRQLLHARLTEHGERLGSFGLIHADLLPQNFLMCGQEPFVIDFDDCGFGWYAYDLAVALYAFIEDSDFVEIAQATIDGYCSVRLLPADEISLLAPMLVVRQLVVLGWFNGRVRDGLKVSGNETIPRSRLILPRLSHAMRSCEVLLDGGDPFPITASGEVRKKRRSGSPEAV